MRYRPHRDRRSKTRFDVALAQRAQRRAPRVSRARVGVVVAVFGLALAALGLRWYTGDDWRVNDIQVSNNTGIPVEAIIGASGLQGEHFQFADLDRAAAAIDDLPGVEAAQVTCTWEWRASCTVVIQPARAMALWESARGKVWNDFEGKVQQATETDAVAAKLTVYVEQGEPPTPNERLDPRMLRALNELLTVQPGVIRYAYSSEYGLMWVNEDNWRIRLGVAEYDGAMSDKLKLARALGHQLAAEQVEVRILDVRFLEAPYYIK
jgi:cell division septal protein FtsQ